MVETLIGIDEAGRGPLAGPVALGIVMIPYAFNVKKEFPGVADSKILSEKKREELFKRLVLMHQEGIVHYAVTFSSARVIDRLGITSAVAQALERGIEKLAPDPTSTFVLLDGLLRAPPSYAQRTIIGGDSIEPLISLASVAAKVSRDRLMQRLDEKFPAYSFALHKGYGTLSHRKAIGRLGLSPLHRRSFCKNF